MDGNGMSSRNFMEDGKGMSSRNFMDRVGHSVSCRNQVLIQ